MIAPRLRGGAFMLRWTLVMAVAFAGCGRGTDDDGFSSSPITCTQACRARTRTCGVAGDCESACQTAQAMAQRLGCLEEHYAALNCTAEYDAICGDDLAL